MCQCMSVLIRVMSALIYVCAPELEADAGKEEAEKGGIQEEEKKTKQTDAQTDVRTLTVKPAEIGKFHSQEYWLNYLRLQFCFTHPNIFHSLCLKHVCAFSCFRVDQRSKQLQTGTVRDDPCLQSNCPPYGY